MNTRKSTQWSATPDDRMTTEPKYLSVIFMKDKSACGLLAPSSYALGHVRHADEQTAVLVQQTDHSEDRRVADIGQSG